MNTTTHKIWFGQVATGIGTPLGDAPKGDALAVGTFVPSRLWTTIARLFDSRTTGGEVRNY